MALNIKKEYHPDGKIRSTVPLINGIHHGVEKTYHENGRLKSHLPFINGKPFGIFKRWDQFGRLTDELMLVGGCIYNENGMMRMIASYTEKNDGLNGANVQFDY